MTLIVLAGLQSQPPDTLEAAKVDGAGALATFRELTIPHLRPYIELGVLLGSIYLVNTFDAVWLMTNGGPGTATTNLPFYLYQKVDYAYDIGGAAAAGVVTVVLTIIVATLRPADVRQSLQIRGGTGMTALSLRAASRATTSRAGRAGSASGRGVSAGQCSAGWWRSRSSCPVLWMVLTAFKPESAAETWPPKFAFSPTLSEFSSVFSRHRVRS